jgi:hypothetical protein
MDCQIILAIVTTCMSVLAVGFSFYAFTRSKREQAYSDLDALYIELLKLGMQYPRFVNPKYTSDYKRHFSDEDELKRYG